jgi:hypothetical protein
MNPATTLKSGLRLRSQVCDTEIIVIRPGSDGVDLRCGGHPMASLDENRVEVALPAPAHSSGTQIGKRYTHPSDPTLELLATKGGVGSLSAGEVAFVLKDAKPLPASD